MSRLVYVSWSDQGRKVCVEKALVAAKEAKQDLTFVAVLDKEDFADLPPSLVELAADELKSLLTAQLQSASARLQADVVNFEVTVKTDATTLASCLDCCKEVDDSIFYDQDSVRVKRLLQSA